MEIEIKIENKNKSKILYEIITIVALNVHNMRRVRMSLKTTIITKNKLEKKQQKKSIKSDKNL